jgi:hypothetical protein
MPASVNQIKKKRKKPAAQTGPGSAAARWGHAATSGPCSSPSTSLLTVGSATGRLLPGRSAAGGLLPAGSAAIGLVLVGSATSGLHYLEMDCEWFLFHSLCV